MQKSLLCNNNAVWLLQQSPGSLTDTGETSWKTVDEITFMTKNLSSPPQTFIEKTCTKKKEQTKV